MSEKLTGGLKGNFSRFLPESGLVLEGGNISGSNLFDLKVNGISKFVVDKNGNISLDGSKNSTNNLYSYIGFDPNNGAGFVVGSQSAGQVALAVPYGYTAVKIASGVPFGFANTSNASTGTQDVFLTRRGIGNLRLGNFDAAAPVAQILSVQSVVAGTTDTAGVDLTITGSQGTGTGAGGKILFQVAPASTTGNTQNALVTALTITPTSNIGIGTSSPADKLQIEGNLYFGTNPRTIYSGGTANLSIQVNTGSIFFLRNNGSNESMRIDASGNVGIGNSSPADKLSVNGTTFVSTSVSVGNSTVNIIINSTSFSGTANNALYLGGIAAANVISNAQFQANLANYAPLAGATFTGNVNINASANVSTDLNIGRNLVVTGNLTVSGNVTVIGANNLSVVDNMIYMNANNTVANPDLGFAGNYNDGTYRHAGFFRDASDAVWKVFDSYLPEPDASPYIDTTNSSFRIANFQANTVYVGNTSVYSTINTTSFTGTANNTTYAYGKQEANLNVNSANSATYLSGTAANGFQTTADLAANVLTLTSNNSNYLGGVVAASYVQNTDSRILSGNLAFTGYTLFGGTGTPNSGRTIEVTGTLNQTAVTQYRSLSIIPTVANVSLSGAYIGIAINPTLNADNQTAAFRGVQFQPTLTTNTTILSGFNSAISVGAAEQIYSHLAVVTGTSTRTGVNTFAYGVFSNVTSVVNTNYGVFTTASGGITNYGLYSNVAYSGNNYNIYSTGGAVSYFANSVGIGNTAPADILSVNGSTYLGGTATVTGNLTIATTGELIISSGAGIYANGSLGTANQVLSSNGSSVYWATPSAGGFSNGQSISVNNFVVTGAFTANSSNGSLGQVLTSNGSGVYWSSATGPRVSSTTTTTSPFSWNSDNFEQYAFTALANALTINADSGTATDGRKIIFRFLDNGTGQALTWTTGSAGAFRAVGVSLPTTTVANKVMYVGCIYNSNASRWDVISLSVEA